jgi:RND superfamily putative drug exporter
MTRVLYALALRCARHRWWVVGIWVAGLLVATAANLVGGSPAQGSPGLTGSASAEAVQLAERAFAVNPLETSPLVIYQPDANFAMPSGQSELAALAVKLDALPALAGVKVPVPGSTSISANGEYAVLNVTVDAEAGSTKVDAVAVLETSQAQLGQNAQVAIGGALGESVSIPDTRPSALLGLAAALALLFVFFRRMGAAVVPIVSSIFGLVLALGILGLLADVIYIPTVSTTVATMLGLGVGIDYALFLTWQTRNLIGAGYAPSDAIARALATAGSASLFAGSVVTAALIGVSVTGISFIATIAAASAFAVICAVAATITLAPALLAIFRDRLISRRNRNVEDADAALDASRWGRFALVVTSHPWIFAVGTLALLLTLAAPAIRMELGVSSAAQLPPGTTGAQAFQLTEDGLGPGANSRIIVVTKLFKPATAPAGTQVSAGGDPRVQDPRLVALSANLAATPGIVSVGETIVSPEGGAAIIEVTPAWGPAAPETSALIGDLQRLQVPDSGGQVNADEGVSEIALIGGLAATTYSLDTAIAERTPLFVGVVLLLAILLLMIAYRSVLIPLKAAAMNLLSIAAAFGVITAVFNWGWGATAIGLSGPIAIDSFVPLLMFAVLFGLSMDYEVFLLTAFTEHFAKTGDIPTAIRRGLAGSGKVVTIAAVIMASVFASFIFVDSPVAKLFGVGLASAVIIDATLVRCLLVPAIMVLIKRGTFWLPQWLDLLLPKMALERNPEAINPEAINPDKSYSADEARVGHRPIGIHDPVRVLIVGGSAIVSWFVVAQIPGPATVAVGAAVSVVIVAAMLLAPFGLGDARGGIATRAIGYALGLALGFVLLTFATAMLPPIWLLGPLAVAFALLAGVCVAAFGVGRSLVFLALMGTVNAAVAWQVVGAAVPADLLIATAVPVLLMFVLVATASALVPRRALYSEAIPVVVDKEALARDTADAE